MRSCAACGSGDKLRPFRGWLLCWTCRRIVGVAEIAEAAMLVRTSGGWVRVRYSRSAVRVMLKEVRELWQLQTTKR